MGAALAVHSEDETALDKKTVDYCRLFWRTATDQYNEISQMEEEGELED